MIRPLRLAAFAIFLSTVPALSAAEGVPEPAQRTDATFRLFRTLNDFTFLKLDSRTGRVWQLQWSPQADRRVVDAINMKPLTDARKPGRFTLYPSANMYVFIMLDQEDGRQWQVQWGTAADKRFIAEIEQ